MGTGLRIFLIDDNDNIKRLSGIRYHRMRQRHPDECLIDCAGKRIRVAIVSLETEGRKPTSIIRIDYNFSYWFQRSIVHFTNHHLYPILLQ